MIGAGFTSLRLCSALLAAHGDEVSPARLCRAAVIVAHVADEWPPELLAAIAYRESRIDPRAVNARTGCWGAMQVSTRRRGDEWAGYRAGVAKLREARRFCVRRAGGDLCILAAYASDPAGVRGRWYRGPRRVLRDAAQLRKFLGCSSTGRARGFEPRCPGSTPGTRTLTGRRHGAQGDPATGFAVVPHETAADGQLFSTEARHEA